MFKVVLTGWQPGLRKVALNRFLRAEAGMTLAQAKDSVDAVLNEWPVEIHAGSQAQAEYILAKIQRLGAIGHIGIDPESKS